jgi:hypothetical protein
VSQYYSVVRVNVCLLYRRGHFIFLSPATPNTEFGTWTFNEQLLN